MKLEKTFTLQMYDPSRRTSDDGVYLLDIKEFIKVKKDRGLKTDEVAEIVNKAVDETKKTLLASIDKTVAGEMKRFQGEIEKSVPNMIKETKKTTTEKPK